jgi:ParG
MQTSRNQNSPEEQGAPPGPTSPGGRAESGHDQPARGGEPLPEAVPDLETAPDPVNFLISAVNTLPPAQRDAVWAWLLSRGAPVTVPAAPGAASLEMAGALLRPGSAALAQSVRAMPAGGQQIVPVRFPSEQHAQLREWCAEHGFSMATVIRGLVARFLEGQRA